MKIKRAALACLFLLGSSLCCFGQYLYVTDTTRVDIFSPTGDFLSYIPFKHPAGLAFDSAGSLYIASGFDVDAIITKVDSQGHQSIFASGAMLADPEGLAFDNLGNLYVATHLGGTIIKIAPDGTQSLFAASDTGSQYFGVAFSSFDGMLYATAGRFVYQFTLGGTRTQIADIPGAGPIAIDALGFLYVAGDDPSIYRVTPQGIVTTFALNAHAGGLTFGPDGNLYAGDSLNHSVDQYNALGVGMTYLTGFNDPEFLVFGPAIPEPSTQMLFLVGAFGCAAVRRIRRRKV